VCEFPNIEFVLFSGDYLFDLKKPQLAKLKSLWRSTLLFKLGRGTKKKLINLKPLRHPKRYDGKNT